MAIFSDELDKGGGGGWGSLSCSSYNHMTSSIYQHLDLEGRRRRGGGKSLISLEAQTDVLLFFVHLRKGFLSSSKFVKPSLAKFSLFFRRPSFAARAGR